MKFGNNNKKLIDDKNAVDYSGYIGQQKLFYAGLMEIKGKISEMNGYLANGWKVADIHSDKSGSGETVFLLEYFGINE